MGMIDRFGRIADTYVQEKSSLLESEQERRRVHMGHAFWPTEVLRDSIIFASMLMVLCFYCWLIPPPLHSAADLSGARLVYLSIFHQYLPRTLCQR